MKEYCIYTDVNNEYTTKVWVKCNSVKIIDTHTVEANGIRMRFSGVVESIDVDGKEFWSKR